MPDGIFLIKDDDSLVKLEESAYDSEDLLQQLLEKYPDLMAGDQMNRGAPRRWLLISREMGVPSEEFENRWSVDHLFLDQDGIPTLVEVKRSSDTRIRREVVGQMLDYAANAVMYWPVEKLEARFVTYCLENEQDPAEKLRELTGDKQDPEEFWKRVKTNLLAGKIRMVFVADVIPSELKRIVEFLNEQMDPAEVIALEIKQYIGDGVKSLVPRVIGQTEQATLKKSGQTKRKWTEEEFLSELNTRQGKRVSETAQEIVNWARSKGLRLWWGEGQRDGSFYPMFDWKDYPYYTITVWTYGKIEIQFQMMKNTPPFQTENKRKQLLSKLNQMKNVDLPEDSIVRRPSIPLSTLGQGKNLDLLFECLNWYLEEIKLSTQ